MTSIDPNFDYCQIIDREFRRRQARNSKYSLTSFARDIRLHPATLSAVLKRRRHLPSRYVADVCTLLKLDPGSRKLFLKSFVSHKMGQTKVSSHVYRMRSKLLPDDQYFAMITEWEYFAVLNLVKTTGFRSDHKHVARRLGLTLTRAQKVCDDLLDWGFLKVKGKRWVRVVQQLRTTDGKSSLALKIAHDRELQLAQVRLHQVPLQDCDYSSSTVAISTKNLAKAKAAIREFRATLAQLLESGLKDEVYLFAIQLFPLSVPERRD